MFPCSGRLSNNKLKIYLSDPPWITCNEDNRHCFSPTEDQFPCNDETLHGSVVKRLETLMSLSLVCRQLNEVALEFFFEVIYISTSSAACKLAKLLITDCRRSHWIRRIILIIDSKKATRMSTPEYDNDFRNTLTRIFESTRLLETFQIQCESSTPEWRAFEESLVDCLPTTVRHFQWNNIDPSYLQSPGDSLLRFFRRAKDNLEAIELTGFFPFPDIKPGYDAFTDNDDIYAYPALRKLKISRSIFCNVALLRTWSITANLECLDFGTVWKFFDGREASAPFFQSSHPHLRCIHAGEESKISPSLAKNILSSAPNLQLMEYFFICPWVWNMWRDAKHDNVAELGIALSHSSIPVRSFFREGGVQRDQRLDVLKVHLRSAKTCFSSLKRVRLRLTISEGLGGSEFETWFKDAVSKIFSPDAGVKVIPETMTEC